MEQNMMKNIMHTCLRLSFVLTIMAALLGIAVSVAEVRAQSYGCADYYCGTDDSKCWAHSCDYCAPDSRCSLKAE